MAYQPAKLRREADIIAFPLSVRRRGLLGLVLAAIVRWWRRPPRPPDLSPRLLEDIGLPPDYRPEWYEKPTEPPLHPVVIYSWRRD